MFKKKNIANKFYLCPKCATYSLSIKLVDNVALVKCFLCRTKETLPLNTIKYNPEAIDIYCRYMDSKRKSQ